MWRMGINIGSMNVENYVIFLRGVALEALLLIFSSGFAFAEV